MKGDLMPKVVDYTLVAAPDPLTLMENVKRFLRSGWVPQGGVTSMTTAFGEVLIVQAMVRYEAI